MTKSMHEGQNHITGEILQNINNDNRKLCNDDVYKTKMATYRNIVYLPFFYLTE